MIRKTAMVGALALFLALPGSVFADAEKGMAALQSGDYKTALQELNADAAKGDADAMFMLSRLYAEGRGVKEDRKVSFQWMEKAAKAGSVRAQGSLGMYYSEGVGTAKDDAKSVEWARRAAEKGDAISQFILGMRYDTGTGVARDPAQAMDWWGKAADRGFTRAQVMLANAYARKATAPDATPEQADAHRIEAAKWLIIADAPRLPGVENALPALKEKMSPQQFQAAEDKAREWRPAGADK